MRVLDLCCGQGRHAVPLAKRGFRVAGQDLSERLLAEAAKAAGEEGVQLELIRSDMREIPWTAEFDGAVNMFTAFGYFEDDRENFRVLEAVARALKPGGRFLIDVIPTAWLLRNWQDLGWTRGEDGLVVLQERRMDWTRAILQTDWTFLEADGRRKETAVRLRIFSPHEMVEWLRRAGLPVEGLFGDFDGSAYGLGSRRLIAVARKVDQDVGTMGS